MLFPGSDKYAKAKQAHLRLGRYGERIARNLLQELGLDILVLNYSGKRGEIDLVAREGDILCFVEVKTRHYTLRSRPGDAVRREKKRRLIRTAHRYLRDIGHPDISYRYDIIEVVFAGARVKDLRYWRGAFTEESVPGLMS